IPKTGSKAGTSTATAGGSGVVGVEFVVNWSHKPINNRCFSFVFLSDSVHRLCCLPVSCLPPNRHETSAFQTVISAETALHTHQKEGKKKKKKKKGEAGGKLADQGGVQRIFVHFPSRGTLHYSVQACSVAPRRASPCMTGPTGQWQAAVYATGSLPNWQHKGIVWGFCRVAASVALEGVWFVWLFAGCWMLDTWLARTEIRLRCLGYCIYALSGLSYQCGHI
ncbi:hypothetical protein CTA1_5027, partial [Colletotrichum tanaceti]